MSDENSCCGFRRKSVVMSFIGICCLTLVVWTVIVTAHPPSPPPGEPVGPVNLTASSSSSNSTINNSSMQAVCRLNSSLSIENVVFNLNNPNQTNQTNQQRIKKYKLGESCKCLCQYNVTLSELQGAIALLKKEKSQKMETKEKPT